MTAVLALVHRAALRTTARGFLGLSLLCAYACGGSAPAPAAGGPPPAMPVEAITLQPTPVEQTTEFVATIKSRRSTTIQPQAEGFLTRIVVKSGDHVKPGQALMDIDATSQQAAVASLEGTRAARDADATYAHQQTERTKKLLDMGAATQQDYDQAVATEKSAVAQLKAADDQIRQQQNELGYYTVKAPTAGTVGDIPVRVGDRVTKTTLLTTVDDNTGLEVYINVPLDRAPELRLGLPVRLLDAAGKVMATEQITFVSPSVDDATQSVLAKAALEDTPVAFRTDQFVRALVVWSTEPELTVPVVSTVRISGTYFVYLVENGPGGTTVARQRPIVTGNIVGNDYVVTSGLAAGDRLVVSGLQKIGDGMPVHATAPEGAGK